MIEDSESEIRKKVKFLKHQLEDLQKFQDYCSQVAVTITINMYEYLDQILIELDQASNKKIIKERKDLEDIFDLD
tara:strand:- start:202 stop:426 length:225 start_codon:yes stop_codon:yes gene_type:complete